MLSTALESRFRAELRSCNIDIAEDALRFAADYAALAIRILPDDIEPHSLQRVAANLTARVELDARAMRILLELVLAPEIRSEVRTVEQYAFSARFGQAAGNALRASLEDDVDFEHFAETWGPGEAVLLLDGLFSICAADGGIDDEELGRLQRAARLLHVDPALVGLLLRKHDVRHAAGDTSFSLAGKQRVVIGRAATSDLVLPDTAVGTRHAELVRTPSGWHILDARSGRPTIVRGEPILSDILRPGDEARIGPYRLVLHASGEALTTFGPKSTSILTVRELTRAMPGQPHKTLLDHISFTVFSGEVIAIVGPSGAGKTTLLHALAGITPQDSGIVQFDGGDLHTLLATDRSIAGFVPQDDVVHAELTVDEALQAAAWLRLGRDATKLDVQLSVDRVVEELDLTPVRNRPIGDVLHRGISGGQRKRVNLGQDLVTSTTRLLFLDEPTSGLDPHTAQDIVMGVRQIADEGRIVFMVTHDTSPAILSLVDHLVVLAPGGTLAWFGPPQDALRYFGVDSIDRIFAQIPQRNPKAWATGYQKSQAWRTYVRAREQLIGMTQTSVPHRKLHTNGASWMRQIVTLLKRDVIRRSRDRLGTGLLLAQAPLLAAAFAVAFTQASVATIFVLVLSSLWLGASVSVRELIADRAVWRRESRIGVGLGPYLTAKFLGLSLIVLAQCMLLTGGLELFLREEIDGVWRSSLLAHGFGFLPLCAVSVLVGLAGMSLGLMISSLAPSSESAVGALPLMLVPQIAFGGLIVKVKEMGALAKALSWLTVTRHGFDLALKTGEQLSVPSSRGVGDTQLHISGILWDLGLRNSADPTDLGLTDPALVGCLVGLSAIFMLVTAWRTDRERDPTPMR